jgi:integrase
VSLVKRLRQLSGKSQLLFVAPTKAGVLSENTFLYALYNMGYHGKATIHGLRSTASTILNEHEFPADVIERQLAHIEKDKVRAAYNAAQYLKQRREMVMWWNDYLDAALATGRDLAELVG